MLCLSTPGGVFFAHKHSRVPQPLPGSPTNGEGVILSMAKKKVPAKGIKDKLNAAYSEMKNERYQNKTEKCNCSGKGTCDVCRSCGK